MSDVFDLLIKHELTVSELYKTYAEKFRKQHTFWSTLAWEEEDHAKNVEKLAEMNKSGHVVFDKSKYNPNAVQTSIDYVKKQIKRIDSITYRNALSIAMTLEESILDGKFFDAFKGLTADARKLLREINKGIEDHVRTVDEALRKLGYEQWKIEK